MKTSSNKQNWFLLIIFYSTFCGLYAQDRGSVWVHGLNSGADDWLKYEQLFKAERKLFDQVGSRPQQYYTSVGAKRCAEQVYYSYIFNKRDDRTIYVGHSNGGVIGRELDVTFPNSLGGLITFGSPLDGAKIANTSENGEATNFVNNGVDKVLAGPNRQGLYFFRLMGLNINDLVSSYIRKTVIPQNPATDLGQQDLKEGSTYLNGIMNRTTYTPKIHVYGNENSPVFWRYLTSYSNIGSTTPVSEDSKYVVFANDAGDTYNTFMWGNIVAAAATGWWTFGIGAVYYSWVADGWAQGRDWFRYDAENGWNSLIGASTPAYRSITYSSFDYNQFSQCMYNSGGYGSGNVYNRYSYCQQQATRYYTYYYSSPVNGQSDAFIKAPSQTGFNSEWSNNATKIEALGVNHIEMLDNQRVEDIFRDVFDGRIGDGFFRTDRR